MRLVTVQNGLGHRLGRMEGDEIDLFDHVGGMRGVIEAGAAGLDFAGRASAERLPMARVVLAPPIANPSKIAAIGLNYIPHAGEAHLTPPPRPLCFAKFPSALIGPGQHVRWYPEVTEQVDYEAELVAVIGRPACRVSRAEALDYVFGYTCGNDITARDVQNRDGQWVRAKSLDTFAPLGPWIVTADEIPDPQCLDIRFSLNGDILQSSNTAQMIFPVAELIHFLSHSFTLLPGDLIFTGTPSGVGFFRDPPIVLKDRDVLCVEIEAIGSLTNTCRVA